jgi:hypothetical protein
VTQVNEATDRLLTDLIERWRRRDFPYSGRVYEHHFPESVLTGRYAPHRVVLALEEWSAAVGRAPFATDWTKKHDPAGLWPRSAKVREIFGVLAVVAGARKPIIRRCHCCPTREELDAEAARAHALWDELCQREEAAGRPVRWHWLEAYYWDVWTPEDGCRHEHDEWEGPSGWVFALSLAGLEPPSPRERMATPSGLAAHGRNRQMVTAGVHVHPVPWSRAAHNIEQIRE